MASTPDSATAPEENAPQQREERDAGEQRPVLRDLVERLLVDGQGAEVAEVRAEQPDADERDQREHIHIGGAREEPPGLLHAPQVADGHQRDEEDAHRDAELLGRRERGRDRGNAGRHRHGDREHVVDEQRAARDERGRDAEVLPRHDVRAAAARIGEEGLAVARRDDGEQHDDDQRQRHQVAEGEHARHGHQDEEDLLGRVGRGGDRVRGEDRQGDDLAEPLMVLFARRDRAADEDPLER